MKKIIPYILVLISASCLSQESVSGLLKKFNNKSVPYISVQELAMPKTKALILDAREIEEYNVSHIKDAVFVGYNTFKTDLFADKFQDKNQKIVVYCSLGIRSEDVAEKLKKIGYTNVYNLYGGIFEWKNNDFTIYNSEEKETGNVHVFDAYWSQWLLKGNKVFNDK